MNKKKSKKRKPMTTNLPLINEVPIHGKDIYPLVVRQVSRKWNGQGRLGSIEYQDLIGEALLALAQGLKRFKPGGVKFTTFVFQRLGGAAHDLIRRELTYGSRYDPTPANDLIRQAGGSDGLEERTLRRASYLRIIDLIEKQLDPLPAVVLIRSILEDRSDREIAKEFHLDVPQVAELRAEAIREIRRLLFLPASDYQDGR